ncbi:MAG: DUF1673 family protein [Methanoculleus bourgensis]|mgnify:FL=1|uniref:DUF1673 family protein n=2 Tax=Methanoculleus bourgensis TaxID=83986 RepID=A0A8T7GYD3_9EURY|nr:DUF1673 family protein [Methanoculleus bourgensis]
MTPHMETIRRYLGWCPNAAAARACRQDAVPGNESGMAAADCGREVVGGAVVDYGSSDIPAVTAVAGAGFFILVIYLSIAFPPSGSLILLAIALTLSAMELYGVIRRTGIEITRDAITLRRPILPAVVIPKDAIVKAEVRENKLPGPSWLHVALVGVLLVSAVAGIYGGLSNPASMRFILGIAAVVFFPVMTCCTSARARYPRSLTITTADKKIAAIYTDDPERIARMLEVS